MTAEAKKTGEPGWKWRRIFIAPIVLFACYQLDALRGSPATAVNETLANGWMWLVAVLVLGYTGLATVQDITAIWRTGTGLPYATPPKAIAGDPVEPDPIEEKTYNAGITP